MSNSGVRFCRLSVVIAVTQLALLACGESRETAQLASSDSALTLNNASMLYAETFPAANPTANQVLERIGPFRVLKVADALVSAHYLDSYFFIDSQLAKLSNPGLVGQDESVVACDGPGTALVHRLKDIDGQFYIRYQFNDCRVLTSVLSGQLERHEFNVTDASGASNRVNLFFNELHMRTDEKSIINLSGFATRRVQNSHAVNCSTPIEITETNASMSHVTTTGAGDATKLHNANYYARRETFPSSSGMHKEINSVPCDDEFRIQFEASATASAPEFGPSLVTVRKHGDIIRSNIIGGVNAIDDNARLIVQSTAQDYTLGINLLADIDSTVMVSMGAGDKFSVFTASYRFTE